MTQENNNPMISIIVPCYNQAQYLNECLQSVLDQTFLDWECIIVNDGSLDNTEDVANKWIAKDSRFQLLKKENGGLSSARNAGIEIAKGEWILPLDADDKIGNQYLELAEKEFNNGYTVIYCNAELFGAENGFWNLPSYSALQLASGNPIFCTAFFQKKNWAKVGGYDTNMIHGLEDWEFWIDILKNGGTVKKLEEIEFYYRKKSTSMISNLQLKGKNEMIRYMEKKHFEFFQQQLGSILDLYNDKLHFEKLANERLQNLESKRVKIVNKLFSLIGK